MTDDEEPTLIKPLNYVLWEQYLLDCEKDELRPSTADFKIWLEERDEE